MKKIVSLALVLITILSLAVPTFAIGGDSNRKAVYEKGVLLTPDNNTGVSGIAPPAYDPINDQINAEKESRLPLPTLSSAPVNITRAPASTTLACIARAQITTAWCGLANVEQVLRAGSSGGHHMPTYHSTSAYDNTNQGGLAYVYGISPTSGTEPSQLTPMLNNYTNSNFSWGYRYIPGSGNTAANDVRTRAHQTVGTDRQCCIVFADTTFYAYYKGKVVYHWVTLNGYTPTQFRIVDPHYDSLYRGSHTIDNYNFGMAIERYNSKPNLIW